MLNPRKDKGHKLPSTTDHIIQAKPILYSQRIKW